MPRTSVPTHLPLTMQFISMALNALAVVVLLLYFFFARYCCALSAIINQLTTDKAQLRAAVRLHFGTIKCVPRLSGVHTCMGLVSAGLPSLSYNTSQPVWVGDALQCLEIVHILWLPSCLPHECCTSTCRVEAWKDKDTQKKHLNATLCVVNIA